MHGITTIGQGLLMIFLLTAGTHGAIMMEEDWNSGSVDTTQWERIGPSSHSSVVDVGGGDYALKLTDSGASYMYGLRSWAYYERGDNMRCTFRLWRGSETLDWNVICGPFVNTNIMEGTYPALGQVEAGLMRYTPYDPPANGIRWGEGVESFLNTGPQVENAFTSAWAAAQSKANAVWVRVWLGNQTGARCEWSTDGTNFHTLKLLDGALIDTIGRPAGSDANGMYSGFHPTCKVGDNSPVWLFFCSSIIDTYVDDLTLQNDAPIWTPPPTPTPPPLPSDSVTREMLKPAGVSYQALVPDTLDLAERATLAVHGLTAFLDESNNYAPWGHYAVDNVNPALVDRAGGPPNWGKIVEATVKMRAMCGSAEGLDEQLASARGMIDYLPPSTVPGSSYVPHARAMLSLAWIYKLSPIPAPALRDLLAEYGEGFEAGAINTPDGLAHLIEWPAELENSGTPLYSMHPFVEGTSARALAIWGMMDNDASIIDLAHKIMRALMIDARFWEPEAGPKAVFTADRAHFNGHMHAYVSGMMGMIYAAAATHDAQLMEFVRNAYEYQRNFGLARVGLFGEGCTVGDMTQTAIMLSETGVGDYWEDVDSYVRNHLTEIQLIDEPFLQQCLRNMDGTFANNYDPSDRDTTNALHRIIGTCPDDATHLTKIPQISAVSTICGPGNVTCGAYLAWESIVRCAPDGHAIVNLLLNRASPWLDVDSYLPYEGKVVIHNKTATMLSVRIPRWVDKSAVRVAVNGQGADPAWLAQYLTLGSIAAGDVVTITFPVPTTTEEYTLKWRTDQFWSEVSNPGSGWTSPNPIHYTMTFKGNTMVDVTPRDTTSKGIPLYRRDAERDGDAAPMRTVTRFVLSNPQGVQGNGGSGRSANK